jgi:predicted nucleic acid-binding protein
MSDYFGDASYWIALVNRDDEFHEPAARYSTLMKLENARIVTTQLVLNEVLNPRSGSSSQQRQDNIDLIDRISRNQQVEIVPQSPEQFSEALELLRARTDDKEWSITDCASFLVMERLGILEALTTDHHFAQAGFSVMMR